MINDFRKMKSKKVKKLKLKPSARDKRRYFLIDEKDNKKVEKAILDYLGVLGHAKSAYLFVKKEKERIVGSVNREELNNVKAALSLAGISVSKVSGTLKGLDKAKTL